MKPVGSEVSSAARMFMRNIDDFWEECEAVGIGNGPCEGAKVESVHSGRCTLGIDSGGVKDLNGKPRSYGTENDRKESAMT
jgi:phage terminase large subunit-like protein